LEKTRLLVERGESRAAVVFFGEDDATAGAGGMGDWKEAVGKGGIKRVRDEEEEE
jgi:hypothetical protein